MLQNSFFVAIFILALTSTRGSITSSLYLTKTHQSHVRFSDPPSGGPLNGKEKRKIAEEKKAFNVKN